MGIRNIVHITCVKSGGRSAFAFRSDCDGIVVSATTGDASLEMSLMLGMEEAYKTRTKYGRVKFRTDLRNLWRDFRYGTHCCDSPRELDQRSYLKNLHRKHAFYMCQAKKRNSKTVEIMAELKESATRELETECL